MTVTPSTFRLWQHPTHNIVNIARKKMEVGGVKRNKGRGREERDLGVNHNEGWGVNQNVG